MHLQRIVKSLKGLFLFSVLLFILTFSASNTFADFYVIAGSKGVGTKINALPYIIASPGLYYIAKDLPCETGVHGITINSDNVTLDLMGFSLVGPDSVGSYCGIFIDGRTNVEIRNGTVRLFGHQGIRENSTLGISHRVINVRVQDNLSTGIALSGLGHLVEKCTVLNNGYHGIYTGHSSTLTGNTCNSNDANGIQASYGSTVTGNTCYFNTDYGIFTGEGSTIIGNTCYANKDYGIYLIEYSLVDQNTAYNNTNVDIRTCPKCIFGTNLPNLTP